MVSPTKIGVFLFMFQLLAFWLLVWGLMGFFFGCAATVANQPGCYYTMDRVKPNAPKRCWKVCPMGGGQATVKPAGINNCKNVNR